MLTDEILSVNDSSKDLKVRLFVIKPNVTQIDAASNNAI